MRIYNKIFFVIIKIFILHKYNAICTYVYLSNTFKIKHIHIHVTFTSYSRNAMMNYDLSFCAK